MDYFSQNLLQIRDLVLKNNSDWLFINTGEEGSGKSYLGLRALAILGVKPKDLRKHIAMNAYEYVKLVEKWKSNEEKGIPLMMDEPVDLFNRESMKELNILLVKIFVVNRSLNFLHILNIPNFYWLDPYLRKSRAKTMWFSAFDLKMNRRIHAWYGKKELAYINSQRAKNHLDYLMSKGLEFIKKVRPKFIFSWDIKELESELIQEYEDLKSEFQQDFLNEVKFKALGNAVSDFNPKYLKELSKSEEFLKRIALISLIIKLSKQLNNSREVWDVLVKEEGYDKDYIIETFKLMKKLKLAKVSIGDDNKFSVNYTPLFHYFEDAAKEKGLLDSIFLKKKKEEEKEIKVKIAKAVEMARKAELKKDLEKIVSSKVKRWILTFAYYLDGYFSQQLIRKYKYQNKGSGAYLDVIKEMIINEEIVEVPVDEIEIDFLKNHNYVYKLTESGWDIANRLVEKL